MSKQYITTAITKFNRKEEMDNYSGGVVELANKGKRNYQLLISYQLLTFRRNFGNITVT